MKESNPRKLAVIAIIVLIFAFGIAGLSATLRLSGQKTETYSAFLKAISSADDIETGETDMKNTAYVQIEDHIAMYGRISAEGTDLSAFRGDLLQEGLSSSEMGVPVSSMTEDRLNSCDCKWYRLKGVRNRRYLLREDPEGNLSAWEFHLFMSGEQDGSWEDLFSGVIEKETEHGYRERLELVLGASDVKDVSYIEVLPFPARISLLAPVSEWKEHAKEIGSMTIEDRRTIEAIIAILKEMSDRPRTEEAGDYVFRSELIGTNVETCYLNGTLGPLTRYERSVRLVFSDGSDDVLHYDAVSGAFEYDGIECVELGDGNMRTINDCLSINTAWSLPDGFGQGDDSDETEIPEASALWSDYDGGCYVTPCGTLVICIKKGGEAFADEIIAAHQTDQKNVHTRIVKYSTSELMAAMRSISSDLKDGGSKTGFIKGVKALGINSIYNGVNVYFKNADETDLNALTAMVECSEMIVFMSDWSNLVP